MTRFRWLAVAVLALLPLAGCTKGNECDSCSSDTDCQDGLVCSTFDDGSKRCGTGTGATQCRVRR
jgi:hypothetical protein